MYVSPNFKTKKALREALESGKSVDVYNPGLGGDAPANGHVTLEGPHYPAPHTWYATAEMKDGRIVKLDGKTIKPKATA